MRPNAAPFALEIDSHRDTLADRHTHLGNVAFYDGHVEPEPPPFAHERPSNEPLF